MFDLMTMADFYSLVIFGVFLAEVIVITIYYKNETKPIQKTIDISIKGGKMWL